MNSGSLVKSIVKGSSSGGGSSSGANLYDIKTLAQAIGGEDNKGWACLGKETPSVFGTTTTVYTDIKTKYDNIEEVAQPLTTGVYISEIQESRTCDIVKFGNKYYMSYGDRIVSMTSITSGASVDWNYVGIYESGLFAGENVLIALSTTGTIYKMDTSTYTMTELTGGTVGVNDDCKLNAKEENGYIYLLNCRPSNTTGQLYKVADSASVTAIELVKTFDYDIFDYVKVGTTYYILTGNGVYSATDLAGTYTLLWQNTFTGGCIFYSSGRFVVVPSSNSSVYYSDDTFATTPSSISSVTENNTYTPSVMQNGVIYCQNRGTVQKLTISTMTFETFATGGYRDYYVGAIRLINNQIVICIGSNISYSGFAKTSYTDTYRIGSSTISQTYYLGAGNTKIVTDNTNSATIYSYLGYFPYFYLNVGTGVTLPRNSNLWTFMYVGDDYEDSNLPTGNTTRLLPQAEVITDMTSTTPTIASVKANADYRFGELTSLTLTAVVESQLGTTIRFSTGSSTFTLYDNASITWVDGSAPTPSASKSCLIFIWNKTGFYKEW